MYFGGRRRTPLGQTWDTATTTEDPVTETTVAEDAEFDQQSGNAAAQDELVAADGGSCDIDDGECDWEVPIDDILGDGVSAEIQILVQTLHDEAWTAGAAVAADATGTTAGLEAHPAGSVFLAGELEQTTVGLQASATYDDQGEATWDADTEARVWDLMSRCDDAREVVAAVNTLANEQALRELAAAVTAFATGAKNRLMEIEIMAETGIELMAILTADFQKHSAMMEKHLNASKQDAANLLIGPLASLTSSADAVKTFWGRMRMFNTTMSEPQTAWDTARAVKTMGLGMANEIATGLAAGGAWKRALGPLGVLINTCVTIVDLGLASTEAAIMYNLVELAKSVNEDYGVFIRFVASNEKSINDAMEFLGKLESCAGEADKVMNTATSTIEGITSKWGGSLYQVG